MECQWALSGHIELAQGTGKGTWQHDTAWHERHGAGRGVQAGCESAGHHQWFKAKAPGALDGPGLLLVKRNFGGDIEHYFFGY